MIVQESHKTDDKEENIPIRANKGVNQHRKNTKKFQRRLYLNVCISAFFMIGEIVGGTVSGSIALLTDAFHIFTDILGFSIAIISLHITQKPSTLKMSFGYHRAEVIGALLSIALIWGLTAWLVSEAIVRFITPEEVSGLIMLITAIGGLIGNVIMGVVLLNTDPEAKDENPPEEHSHTTDTQNLPKPTKKKTTKSLNMRAATIHVLGDTLQSVGVSIAGGIIYARPEYMIADPICTLLFCVVVLATTIPILKDCIVILMEATPSNCNIEGISKDLGEIKDVSDVHDLHIWSLSSGKISFSCHLVTDNPNYALDKATNMLKEKHNIRHLNIQTEDSRSMSEFVCENDLH